MEKAKVRLEHWIHHNDQHIEEYELFADQLEDAGKGSSARYVREMIELSIKSAECLKNALQELG